MATTKRTRPTKNSSKLPRWFAVVKNYWGWQETKTVHATREEAQAVVDAAKADGCAGVVCREE